MAARGTLSRRGELSLGYDAGATLRTGFVHGPRGSYGYAWSRFALTLGASAEFTSRSLAESDERLTSGYGRVAFELRLPLGSFVSLRAGAGARAGLVLQTIAPTGASAASGTPPATKSAFAFGPEIVVGSRFTLSRAWFCDLLATGGLPFLREEDAIRGITTLTAAASLGLQF